MSLKYKILWFLVDIYYRERYFFICDCNQAVKKPRANNLCQAAENKTARCLIEPPVFRFIQQCTSKTSPWLPRAG